MNGHVITICNRWYLRGNAAVDAIAEADHFPTRDEAVTRRTEVVKALGAIDANAITIRYHRG